MAGRVVEDAAWAAAVSHARSDQDVRADEGTELHRVVRSLAAPVRVQVTSSRGRIGATTVVGVHPEHASIATRRLRGVAGRVGAVPDVQVSVVATSHLVDSILALLPSARAWEQLTPSTDHVDVPIELAVALMSAIADDDAKRRDAILTLIGVEGVPPLLDALCPPLGDATIVVGGARGSLRYLRLLLSSRGWVRLAVEGGALRHQAVDTEHIARELTFALVAALDGGGA